MALHADDLEPGRVYTRADLLERGAHSRLFTSGTLLRVLPGCYTRADAPASLHEIARVLQVRRMPGATISHESAAELLGLPLPMHLTRAGGALIHCRSGAGGRVRRGRLVHAHPSDPPLRYRVRGLLVSHPVVVLQELTARMTHDERVIALDALAGRGTAIPQMPLARIREVAADLQGRGAQRIRDAAGDARERVWSPMETRTRLLLVRAGYPEPTPNLEVRDPLTGSLVILDLAFPALRVAIEYDGDQHRVDRAQWRRDRHKDEMLHRLGWVIVRITADDLRVPDAFFLRLSAALER